MDPTPLVVAIGTAIAGILTAAAALLNALRKLPRQTSRTLRLVTLLERIRDWLQGNGLWEDVPTNLKRDINRALEAPELEEEEKEESGGRRSRDE